MAAQLEEVGYQVEYLESGAPARGNVFARLKGADSSRSALLIHGHLDVVPAEPADWSVHPFSGAVEDGYVWGRGAVDMKGGIACSVAAVLDYLGDHGGKPREDGKGSISFLITGDEEDVSINGTIKLLQWAAAARGKIRSLRAGRAVQPGGDG